MATSDGKTVNPHQPLIVTSIPVRPRRVRQGLLLLPPTQPMPELLLTILKKRGLTTKVVGDLPAVMAELARNPVTILILVQPMAWNNLRELGRALERYYPKTPCWRFDPPQADAPQGRLGPWDWDQLQIGEATTLEDSTPAQPPAEVQNQSRRHQHRQVAEPLLTREELDMLLDHSWERQSHTRRPRQRHETEDGL